MKNCAWCGNEWQESERRRGTCAHCGGKREEPKATLQDLKFCSTHALPDYGKYVTSGVRGGIGPYRQYPENPIAKIEELLMNQLINEEQAMRMIQEL